jgi:hypothetical protein
MRLHVALVHPESRNTMEITMPGRSLRKLDRPIEDSDAHVPSLSERAAAAARAELSGDRAGILGAVSASPLRLLLPPRRVPERWTFIHVMERLEEAFRILARLPMPTRPRGYVNSMPFYRYDRADLNAQLETQEFERLARVRNYVRIPPSPAEIARMEEALRWPAEYLEENRALQEQRHADSTAVLRDLAEKLDRHAASVEMIRPTVAALELSRSKLATWASMGFAAVVVFGWLIEAALKWAVDRALSHFQ